jgi:hypothetical protein
MLSARDRKRMLVLVMLSPEIRGVAVVPLILTRRLYLVTGWRSPGVGQDIATAVIGGALAAGILTASAITGRNLMGRVMKGA